MSDDGDSKILIPTYIDKQIRGYIKVNLFHNKKSKYPKYINTRGQWCNYSLLGYDLIKSNKIFQKDKSIILVEGPKDCMKMHQAGLPALGIFGTNNWNQNKLNFIQSLGTEIIYICMDGDKPGRKANKKIQKSIEFVPTKIIELPDNTDPAMFNKTQLKYLYKINKKGLIK